MAPLTVALGLTSPVDKALLVVAIGAGASTVSHANDSFFWVVTQMSGLNVRQGYLLHSATTAILGLASMLVLTLLQLILS